MLINIMTRDIWQALECRSEAPCAEQVTHVFWMNVKKMPCYTVVHCREVLKRAQRYNMQVQNQRDIRYNFMVGGDGNVYEGRGFGFVPLLPKAFFRLNMQSIIIGFMGNFNTVDELPELMFTVGKDLTEYGVSSNYIASNFTFHDFLTTGVSSEYTPNLNPREHNRTGNRGPHPDYYNPSLEGPIPQEDY